ncbi:porin [Massilia sp. TS11]|uniref:porin n=1 Tax=Massilia sp. TS11 TaxID=2908003 RepID=UPI001EDC4C18|nr:porin [Massilia sp. TS11]MCG2583580.1 porin [Massilia sp. TS11]
MQKRSLIALALAMGAGLAHADSNVSLYGVIDAALARTTNTDAAGHAATKMASLSGSLPSRLGFRGSEDLGGGLAAVFTLEDGFNPDTGVQGQGGRLFGRQAWVGLRGGWGTLQLGRIPNMTFLATARSDVLRPNLFSISSIDLYLPNARSDNALGYLGNFNGVLAGATYSLGRDASAAGGPAATNCAGEVSGNARACRQYTALLGYESKAYGASFSYDKLFGNAGAANGLTSSDKYDRRLSANAYVMLGSAKLGGGLIRRHTLAASGITNSDLVYLGVSVPQGQWTLDAQVARKDVQAAADDTTLLVLRASYALSPRSAVYASLGRMDNHGNAAIALDAGGSVGSGKTQSGVMGGLRHLF